MTTGLVLALTLAYFPPPDSAGGWRARPSHKFDPAFEHAQTSSKHGGLLVVQQGRLVYERYFGRGSSEATPNTASCGKSFTSIALGILIHERPDLFPDGLDQKVFTPKYLPKEAFPLNDPRKADIKLGQLLAMTAGIPGNNPGYVNGRPITLDPPGPDGWPAMVDSTAFGLKLWRPPGGGYSYATSSVHLASIILRHVTGMELEQYIDAHLARPLGWGRWGFGYRRPEITHTPGGGGIMLRATDMVRFAYLLLHNGRWKDRQIVPAEYVRQCGRPSPYNPHFPYSLQFHVNADGHVAGVPRDAFWKPGSGGHCFYVVPSLDLVVYKMGGRDDQYDLSQPYDNSRKTWKPGQDPDGGVQKTLQLVVTALKAK